MSDKEHSVSVETLVRELGEGSSVQEDDPATMQVRPLMTLIALALGTFCIGTTEFASMGMIQLFSSSLTVDIPTATLAITAYAIGVVVGAPVLTVATAGLNRRTLLLLLMATFIVGNLLSAAVDGLGLFVAARFLTGLPQGAYFGAGSVVAAHIFGAGSSGRAFAVVMTGLTVATIFGSPTATFLGQMIGWRGTYLCIAGLGIVAFLSIWVCVPRSNELSGSSMAHELYGLRDVRVWLMMAIAALGISSIFAVYTFIGTFVTDLLRLGPQIIPLALGVFGIGMTAGNIYGGRLADTFPNRGILLGYGAALLILAALAVWGGNIWVLFTALFGVGAATMAAVPTIQVRLVKLAPASKTLMGAMNLASLNVANALGAWAGGVSIGAGLGLLSAVWTGFALTAAGLILFLATMTVRTAKITDAR